MHDYQSMKDGFTTFLSDTANIHMNGLKDKNSRHNTICNTINEMSESIKQTSNQDSKPKIEELLYNMKLKGGAESEYCYAVGFIEGIAATNFIGAEFVNDFYAGNSMNGTDKQ